MNLGSRKMIAGLSVVAALAVAAPGSALARGGGGTGGGGGGGGGGVVTPPATDASCATLEATNSGVLDQIASGRRTTLDFSIANCSRHVETLNTTFVGNGYSLLSLDPLVEDRCQTAPFLGNTITLKPNEKRSFSVLPATCWLEYGTTGRQWTYDVTTTDAADGSTLATEVSVLRQRTGI